MEHSFLINWGEVHGSGEFPAGWKRYALWPAPVNEDVCFAEAGFKHFKYEDEQWSEPHWDAQAEILQQRLLEVLATIGAPVLLSEPLLAKRALATLWKPREPLPLADQLRWPILDDSLPEVVLRFGDVLELRTGGGHELYWIALSPDCPLSFDQLLAQLAVGWPVQQVQLDWGKLSFTG
ncbi:MAG: hypothetical protein PHP57_05655 [Sideroxydans sp.]|nr:hypothetical protein [Sideroxydans sp.]